MLDNSNFCSVPVVPTEASVEVKNDHLSMTSIQFFEEL